VREIGAGGEVPQFTAGLLFALTWSTAIVHVSNNLKSLVSALRH